MSIPIDYDHLFALRVLLQDEYDSESDIMIDLRRELLNIGVPETELVDSLARFYELYDIQISKQTITQVFENIQNHQTQIQNYINMINNEMLQVIQQELNIQEQELGGIEQQNNQEQNDQEQNDQEQEQNNQEQEQEQNEQEQELNDQEQELNDQDEYADLPPLEPHPLNTGLGNVQISIQQIDTFSVIQNLNSNLLNVLAGVNPM